MSQIIEVGSYEKLFDDLINENIVDLNGQTLIVHIREMQSAEILEGIKKKLKLLKKWFK